MSESRKGLVLNLPHAPLTPHFIPGVPGFYRPDVPHPVGGDGELDLETAKNLDAGPQHLKLVDIPKAQVKEAEELRAKDIQEARQGHVALIRAKPTPTEAEHIKEAEAAAKGGAN